MRGLLRPLSRGGLVALAVAAVFAAAPVAAQGSYSPYNETASAALARYVRTLASDPRDFTTLIGAGRAALELGDAQAAAGFFARADDVNPRSPLPQAGMGAVSVLNGEPMAALPYFTRAEQLGATIVTLGCDRGLAYDLLGRQSEAQAEYRAALKGPDGEEARRRLALSLAISGDRAGALEALSPLLAQRDVAAGRTRAFVLALTGDPAGAMVAINSAMPGSSGSLSPFLQRLPGLQAGQKAAAVNLGIFPDAGDVRYASASPVGGGAATNRLAGIDEILRQPNAPSQPPATQPQLAYAAPVARPATVVPQRPAPVQRKLWLQLASGSNAAALPSQFERIKSKDRDLFDGVRGYLARSTDRFRLVIGPFRSASDADIFAEDLGSMNVSAFKWSNSETDQIVPIGT